MGLSKGSDLLWYVVGVHKVCEERQVVIDQKSLMTSNGLVSNESLIIAE